MFRTVDEELATFGYEKVGLNKIRRIATYKRGNIMVDINYSFAIPYEYSRILFYPAYSKEDLTNSKPYDLRSVIVSGRELKLLLKKLKQFSKGHIDDF